MVRAVVTHHWSGFDLPGRELSRAEAFAYARACWPSGAHEELQFLALQIALLTALDDVFDAMDASVHADPLVHLLPWRSAVDAAGGSDNGQSAGWAEMRAALAALDWGVRRLARGDAGRREAVHAWWRRQAERQLVAFYREAQ
jgi:hypothetical protein